MTAHDRLAAQFGDQIKFLRSSCASFDKGFEGEAKRLAVTTRLLLHDTKSSTSLLQQLELKDIPFLTSTPGYNQKNVMPYHGLISIGIAGSGASFRAPLGDGPPDFFRWISFEEWWEEIVFDDRKGNQLTRKAIILELANREGGAHVDDKLTPSYEAIAAKAFWSERTEDGDLPLGPEIIKTAMRQIAYELLRTFESASPPKTSL